MEEDNNNFVIVLKSGSGESISVEVFPNDTVKDLKERIESQVGIPLDFDEIKVDGKSFNDDTNILEYFTPGSHQCLYSNINFGIMVEQSKPQPVESKYTLHISHFSLVQT